MHKLSGSGISYHGGWCGCGRWCTNSLRALRHASTTRFSRVLDELIPNTDIIQANHSSKVWLTHTRSDVPSFAGTRNRQSVVGSEPHQRSRKNTVQHTVNVQSQWLTQKLCRDIVANAKLSDGVQARHRPEKFALKQKRPLVPFVV